MPSSCPLVSFVVGVYNTKNFEELDTSIKSMLDQTYENIEIVICDDCSTNGVYEYLLNQYNNNKKIKLIRNKKNLGLAGSLNHCLQHAKGEYIARQDDDDYSDFTRIEKQMNFLLENSEYDFVSAGLSKFDCHGVWDSFIPQSAPEKRDFKVYSQHVHACTLFKLKCLDIVGGYSESEKTFRAEDYDLFMRLYAMGYRGYNLQEVLYFYNYSREHTRKINYRHKIVEAKTRYKGFKLLNLPAVDFIYVLKPLIAGLIPEKLKYKIKKVLS